MNRETPEGTPATSTPTGSTSSATPDRRGFIRLAILGSLGLVGAVLLRRSCAGRGACDSCGVHGSCELPWKEARK